MKFGSKILNCFLDDETDRKICPISSSSCQIKPIDIFIIFLVVTVLFQYSYLIYLKHNYKTNGVTKIRTRDTSISTKIEQKVKHNPRYFGKKRTLFIV